jgi:hypothetical protein
LSGTAAEGRRSASLQRDPSDFVPFVSFVIFVCAVGASSRDNASNQSVTPVSEAW